MSTSIIASRSNYIVSDTRLEAAMAELQAHDDIEDDIRSAAWGVGTSVIYPNCGDPFGGQVSNTWLDSVKDFLLKHCEDGSYATFADEQDGFMYYLVERTGGIVAVTASDPVNPFNGICDQLEGLDTAPTYAVFCDGRESRKFDDFDEAMRYCARQRDKDRDYYLSRGKWWTSKIEGLYYVESRRIHHVTAC